MTEEKAAFPGPILPAGTPSPWRREEPAPVRKLNAMRIRVPVAAAPAAGAPEAPPRAEGRPAVLGVMIENVETVSMTGDADIDMVRRQLVQARGEIRRVQEENQRIRARVEEISGRLEAKFGKIDGKAFRESLDVDSLSGDEGRKFRRLLSELESSGNDDDVFRTTRFAGRHMGKML